jgi:hypothetical protein
VGGQRGRIDAAAREQSHSEHGVMASTATRSPSRRDCTA